MPEGRVGLTVAAAVEPVSLVLAAAGVERRRTAEVGEGRFVAQPLGIVAGGDEECGGGVGSDAEGGDKFGRSLFDQGFEDGVDARRSPLRE